MAEVSWTFRGDSFGIKLNVELAVREVSIWLQETQQEATWGTLPDSEVIERN